MKSPTSIEIPLGPVTLQGNLALPSDARALVVFSHGSGSSRLSPRNRFVAEMLRHKDLGTLLFDLLTPEEDEVYATRFDIDLLTERLIAVTRWLEGNPQTAGLSLGYFGSSTGAASALRAAAQLEERIGAVVSRGGRPDLAMESLPRVKAPTLLIVGGEDTQVLALNRKALARLDCEKRLAVVPGATHLFEEPGALEEAADLAAAWFAGHLVDAGQPAEVAAREA
jgi:pimeloyl-ACP methyl ester carboxylesterase